LTWGTPYSQRQGAPKIDLLPRQLVEQRQTLRQRSGIGAGFLVLLAVLGIWYAMESRQLNQAREQADQERAVATGLRARRAQLQPLADLESQIAAAEQLRASVYKREVRFSSVMRDISAIVPDDVWLTSMAVAFAGDSSSGTTGQSGSTTSQSGQGAAAVTLDPVSTAVPALTVVIP
jgi:Tfp pilus assembly protein PilN